MSIPSGSASSSFENRTFFTRKFRQTVDLARQKALRLVDTIQSVTLGIFRALKGLLGKAAHLGVAIKGRLFGSRGPCEREGVSANFNRSEAGTSAADLQRTPSIGAGAGNCRNSAESRAVLTCGDPTQEERDCADALAALSILELAEQGGEVQLATVAMPEVSNASSRGKRPVDRAHSQPSAERLRVSARYFASSALADRAEPSSSKNPPPRGRTARDIEAPESISRSPLQSNHIAKAIECSEQTSQFCGISTRELTRSEESDMSQSALQAQQTPKTSRGERGAVVIADARGSSDIFNLPQASRQETSSDLCSKALDHGYFKVCLTDFPFDSLADCLRNAVARMAGNRQLIAYLQHEKAGRNYPMLGKCLANRQWHPAKDDNKLLWRKILGELRSGCRAENAPLQSLAYHFYRNLSILPFAEEVLQLYRFCDFADVGTAKSRRPYSSQLREICERIDDNRSSLLEWCKIQIKKAASKLNLMDANMHNTPFFAGTFEYQIAGQSGRVHCIQQLRHPTPTIEIPTGRSGIEIAPEYMAFLREATKRGESVLYSNHQSHRHPDEKKRIEALQSLEALFPKSFYLITLPVLSEIGDRWAVGRGNFCDYLLTLFFDSATRAKTGLYFSANIELSFVLQSAEKWVNFLKENLITDDDALDNTLKLTYVSLLQSLVRRDIALEKNITFCNNTCKDAIDRGAIHLFLDVYWAMITSCQEDSRARLNQLTTLTVYPAFAAKKQAILKDRLAQILAFAEKMESLSPSAKQKLRAAWRVTSGLESLKFRFEYAGRAARDQIAYRPGEANRQSDGETQGAMRFASVDCGPFAEPGIDSCASALSALQVLKSRLSGAVDELGISPPQFEERLNLLLRALSDEPFALAISQVEARAQSTHPGALLIGVARDKREVQLAQKEQVPVAREFQIQFSDTCLFQQKRVAEELSSSFAVDFACSLQIDVAQFFTSPRPEIPLHFELASPRYSTS